MRKLSTIAIAIVVIISFVFILNVVNFELLNSGQIDGSWAHIGVYVYYNSIDIFHEMFYWDIKSYTLSEKMKISRNTKSWGSTNNTGCMTIDDSFMVFAMRTPKAASTTLEELVVQLSKKNNFAVSMVTTLSPSSPTSEESYRKRGEDFMHYFTSLHRRTVHVAHLKFLPFRSYELPVPIYVGTIRDPIDRVISHYNYDYFGDRPMHPTGSRRLSGTPKPLSFIECVRASIGYHNHSQYYLLPQSCFGKKYINVQLRYFCNMVDVRCKISDPNANDDVMKWPYETALSNIKNEFAVVIITEYMTTYIKMLEKVIPSYFDGVYDLYSNPGEGVTGLHSNTNTKVIVSPPSAPAIANSTAKSRNVLPDDVSNFLKHMLRHEIKLYEAAKTIMKERSDACQIPLSV